MWVVSTYHCNLNISPGILKMFWFLAHPQFQKAVQMSHTRPGDGQMPHPRGLFFKHLTGQDCFKTICYKYLFHIKVDKGTSCLHGKVSLSFFGPVLVSHWVISSARSLNIFSLLVVYERSNSPLSTTLCQIPHPCSGSKVKFPTPPGGCWGYKLIGA